MSTPLPLQDILLLAVRQASRATRFVQAAAGIDGMAKEDRSPVTVADWASQAVVALTLRAHSATHAIPLVGEEDASLLRSAECAPLLERVVDAVSHALSRRVETTECLDAIDAGRAAPCARFLTLDPVDGTKGFLRRQQYALSLALIQDGVVVHGVVGCPNLPEADGNYDHADPIGSIAWASRGSGAWIAQGATDAHAHARRLAIAPWKLGDAVRACESVESAHSKQDLSAELLRDLGAAGTPARLDSQCKYVVVARGGADVYLRFPVKAEYREKIWDHAAGALVASEAGACVTDVDGKPLDFGCGRELLHNRGVIAGHPLMVERLVTAYAARVK